MTIERTQYVEQKPFQPKNEQKPFQPKTEEKPFEPRTPPLHREPRDALDQLADSQTENNSSSCLTAIWNGIKAFFRFLFCMSQDTTPETTSSTKTPPIQTQESPSLSTSSSAPLSPPSTLITAEEEAMPELIEVGTSPSIFPIPASTTQGFEALQQLEDPFILNRALLFFEENPAEDGALLYRPLRFFSHACSQRIQKWILYALVTRKNPARSSSAGLEFIVKYPEPYKRAYSELIQAFIISSKPSIQALMHEFEVTDSSNKKTITIQEDDLPKIEAILEQDLRTTIIREKEHPTPVIKRPPPTQEETATATGFIARHTPHQVVNPKGYKSSSAKRDFKELTEKNDPSSNRIQELILSQLVDKGELSAIYELLHCLSRERFDTVFEGLWRSPRLPFLATQETCKSLGESIEPVNREKLKEIFEQGLSPTPTS